MPTERDRPSTAARRVLAALLIVAVVGVGTSAGARTEQETWEARLYDLQNESRVAHGLAPLAYHPGLTAIARDWAEDLAATGWLRHNPDLVAQVDVWVTHDWRRLGENVGYSRTAEEVFHAFMGSPPHRDNILGDFGDVGVGVVRGTDGRLWTVVIFLRV